MISKRCLFVIFIIMCFGCFQFTYAEDVWQEEDFVFYNADMEIIKRPVASSKYSGYHIGLNEDEEGQTFRGLKVGDYYEELGKKYDLKDAEWEIYNSQKSTDGVNRAKELTEKWRRQGKTAKDILSMADFLFAKGYYFTIDLDVYREAGRFCTKSQCIHAEEIYNEKIESAIEQVLERYGNQYTREEIEKAIDESYKDILLEEYYREHWRVSFSVCVKDSKITRIEIADHYYRQLDKAFSDDGRVYQEYAYVLELKDTGTHEWEMVESSMDQQKEEQYPLFYKDLIVKYSELSGIDKAFIASVIYNESSFNAAAESRNGFRGLMQIGSDMGKAISEAIKDGNYTFDQMFDPEKNLKYGCWLLMRLLHYYNNDYACAICAYHDGIEQVDSWLKNEEYSEDGKTLIVDKLPSSLTRSYVNRIMRDYEIYSRSEYWEK